MECEISSHNKHDFCFRFCNDSEDIVSCYACDEGINGGRAYGCKTCNYWLHENESCLEKVLASTILHPLHPQHQLTLTYIDRVERQAFICKDCCCLRQTLPRYRCVLCDNLEIDIVCASFAINNHYKPLEDKEREEKTVLRNQYHIHPLKPFKFKFRELAEGTCATWYGCRFCYKPLYGICYGCLGCEFYLHDFCLRKKLPKRLMHPFHPSHSLYLRYTSNFNCNACNRYFSGEPVYCCDECRFGLHCCCASLLPTLKLEWRHSHPLTYFDISMSEMMSNSIAKRMLALGFGTFTCDECKSNRMTGLEGHGYYRCVQCDFTLHFGCSSITSEAKSRYHKHALVIKTRVIEDYYGEYYCDICEEERDPRHYVYYCEECKFIAHIHCVLNEERGGAPQIKAFEEDRETESDEEFLLNHQIVRSLHDHHLSLFEAINEVVLISSPSCRVCAMKILGPAYGCESCRYYVHKACGELPHLIMSNPLHIQHPLTFSSFEDDGFVCDKCEKVSYAHAYFCHLCNFKLDLKCVTDTGNSIIEDQKLKPKSNFFHFAHYHPLASCNISGDSYRSFTCFGCLESIIGPAYCCLECKFFLHQSCYFSLPKEMQCPLHPLHTMEAVPFLQTSYLFSQRCYACKLPLSCYRFDEKVIYYRCLYESDEFLFHFICLKSLRKALKSNFHKYDLYYFGTDTQKMLLIMGRFMRVFDRFPCNICRKSCLGRPFYRCVEFEINFHLECIPIPQAIKSKQHIHPLILKNSFMEDDSGEYYCDVCEEERDGKDHVYYCEECHGLFVAHIQCILNKEEGTFSPWGGNATSISITDTGKFIEYKSSSVQSDDAEKPTEYDSYSEGHSGLESSVHIDTKRTSKALRVRVRKFMFKYYKKEGCFSNWMRKDRDDSRENAASISTTNTGKLIEYKSSSVQSDDAEEPTEYDSYSEEYSVTDSSVHIDT